MDTAEQLAVNAEKTFNNTNRLLITFYEDSLNKNTIKHLHNDIKDVHILQPNYIPKRRCIIEVKDRKNLNTVKDLFLKQRSSSGFVTAEYLNNLEETYEDIDPYRLHIRNLPESVTETDIKQLYPLSVSHIFVPSDINEAKSVLVNFATADEAILGYKLTNLISYLSNKLSVQFYRRKHNFISFNQSFDVEENSEFEREDESDYLLSEDDINLIDDEDFSNKPTTEDNFEEDSDDQDDVRRWKELEDDYMKNKNVSDTLLIQNFPINTTDEELVELFPNCFEYEFISINSETSKNALVSFQNVKEAVKTFINANEIYKSNILQMDYYFQNNSDVSLSQELKINNLNNSSEKMKMKQLKKEVSRTPEKEENTAKEVHNLYQKNRGKNNSKTNLENSNGKTEIANDKIDPCILHVQNLPLKTTLHDLQQIYPNQDYQILPEKTETENSASAFIYFKTASEALEAYNITKNFTYKSQRLSVNFKSKTLKVNPLALKKRKKNNFKETKAGSSKKTKNNLNDSDDVIFVTETQNGNIINEDDVEFTSEDEHYIDDVDVYIESENDFFEELTNTDNEFQDTEIDNHTFLPLDEVDDLND